MELASRKLEQLQVSVVARSTIIESKEDLLHEIASQYISDLVQSGHRINIEYKTLFSA